MKPKKSGAPLDDGWMESTQGQLAAHDAGSRFGTAKSTDQNRHDRTVQCRCMYMIQTDSQGSYIQYMYRSISYME